MTKTLHIVGAGLAGLELCRSGQKDGDGTDYL